MPDFLNFDTPLVAWIVYGALGLLALTVIAHLWGRRREARDAARRRTELREQYSALHVRQQEVERLATRIIATSSTTTIAGFNITRQIEAVFTDGHETPTKAAEVLKALAAEKGANAIINVIGERTPNGKCIAHGDAVIVQPIERPRREPVEQSEPPSTGAVVPEEP